MENFFRREYGSGDHLGHTFPAKYFNSITDNHLSRRKGKIEIVKKENKLRSKKDQNLLDQFSPMEGSTKRFPVHRLENQHPTLRQAESIGEKPSSSSWTPQFTFPGKDKIIEEHRHSDVDESRFSKLLELLSRKKELSKSMSLAKMKNRERNPTESIHLNSEDSQSDRELPFLNIVDGDVDDVGGGGVDVDGELGPDGEELARQKRKGAGEEPRLEPRNREDEARFQKKAGYKAESEVRELGESKEEAKPLQQISELWNSEKGTLDERTGGMTASEEWDGGKGGWEEPKKRRSAAPPEEEEQIVRREIENQTKEAQLLGQEYYSTVFDEEEYFESKEDEMRPSNSILSVAHIRPPARKEKQVGRYFSILKYFRNIFRRASIRSGDLMAPVHLCYTSTQPLLHLSTCHQACAGEVMEVWRSR